MKAVAAFSILPLALIAGPFEVSLVQAQLGRPLGGEVPFEVKPMGHEAGLKLSFLVRGENLVAFKDDSVDVKSFKLADGREWSRTRSGRPNWDQESFAKVSEDGTLGSFAISFPGDLFGSFEGSTLDGTITVITASKPEEKKIELVTGDKTKRDLGPFQISCGEGGGLLGGEEHGTTIAITGNHQAIIGVVVMDGDVELEGGSSSWSGESKSFHLGKAKGGKLAVTLRYWTDLKEEAVPFKMEPVKK